MTTATATQESRRTLLVRWGACLASILLWGVVAAAARGQSPRSGSGALIDQPPFDVVTLKETSGGAAIKVLPLPRADSSIPSDPGPDGKLQVRLYEDDDKEYEIRWRDVAKIETFDALVLIEAERLVEQGEFDTAFRSFAWLAESSSELPRFSTSFNRLLYLEANALFRAGRDEEALTSLESLIERAPRYSSPQDLPDPASLFDEISERVAAGYFQQRDFASLRALIRRVQGRHPSLSLPSINRWQQRISMLATEKRDQARANLERGEFRAAIAAVQQMLEIWPEVAGGRELEMEVSARYPLVRVGVLQPAIGSAGNSLANWSARRTETLLRKPLVDFMGIGAEGGQYQFAYGLIEPTDDQRGLVFRISAEAIADGWTGHRITVHLSDLARFGAADYRPLWAGLVDSIASPAINEVRVGLRRPHVLPVALLAGSSALAAGPPEDLEDPAATGSPFRIAEGGGGVTQFVANGEGVARLAEIVERRFVNSRTAVAALRNNEIDIVDRLFPADAARLARDVTSDSPLAVERYGLPTVHMLLVNTDNPFLAAADFRRALVYGIDREAILGTELLGGEELAGCRVLSGPFPAGTGDRDPLAYAYDLSIEPRRYTPLLAKFLGLLAREQLEARGAIWRPLTIGFPPHEAGRIACDAIASQLNRVGIECELVEMAPEQRRQRVDLRYIEVVMREPLVDAHRLLGERGVAPAAIPTVSRALRQLEYAQSWSEVRDGLLGIHQAVHDEVAVVPLWQTIDYFAYNRRLRNIGEQPLSLYQHVDQWRLGLRVATK